MGIHEWWNHMLMGAIREEMRYFDVIRSLVEVKVENESVGSCLK